MAAVLLVATACKGPPDPPPAPSDEAWEALRRDRRVAIPILAEEGEAIYGLGVGKAAKGLEQAAPDQHAVVVSEALVGAVVSMGCSDAFAKMAELAPAAQSQYLAEHCPARGPLVHAPDVARTPAHRVLLAITMEHQARERKFSETDWHRKLKAAVLDPPVRRPEQL